MHYYKKNIGDYHKKAGRLSMLEHGAYTLLIDACYDRERFPTEDEAIEWTWARTQEEEAAVRFVLARFFDLRDGIYVQARIEEEIAKYHANAETNARIAKEREDKRRNGARTVPKASPGVHEAPPNQEPRTSNQEPVSQQQVADAPAPKAPKFDPLNALLAEGVPEQVARDWLAVRKAKRAPLTESALRITKAEAQKASLSLAQALEVSISRGWQGFQAEWLRNPSARAAPASRSAMNRIGIDSQTPEGWGDGSDL